MWWKIVLFLWIAAFSALGIVTPIAGSLSDLWAMNQMSPGKEIPVKLIISDKSSVKSTDRSGVVAEVADKHGQKSEAYLPFIPTAFGNGHSYLVRARWDAAGHRIVAVKLLGTDPGFAFPFIPGLEERAKIIFFHVPMAWLTVVAFLVSMWFGIAYLRKKDMDDDIKSSVSAGLGLLFCILATTTGSVWAKFNWGSFWNWDPRETSIFVLLLVYGAFFALRSAIDVEEKRASLSAVYSILAFVTVPFFIFIMPRIMPGLHPGSTDDVNSGPVVSTGGMDASMRIVLYAMLAGLLVFYAWLMRIQVKVQRIKWQRAAAE
jgi:heme exporter protein C